MKVAGLYPALMDTAFSGLGCVYTSPEKAIYNSEVVQPLAKNLPLSIPQPNNLTINQTTFAPQ